MVLITLDKIRQALATAQSVTGERFNFILLHGNDYRQLMRSLGQPEYLVYYKMDNEITISVSALPTIKEGEFGAFYLKPIDYAKMWTEFDDMPLEPPPPPYSHLYYFQTQ